MAARWAGLAAGVGLCALVAALAVGRRKNRFRATALLAAALAGGVAAGGSSLRNGERRADRLLPVAGVAWEGEFVGRVLTLPEAAPEDERVLLLRGGQRGNGAGQPAPLTVRLVVGPSPADARSVVDRLRTGDQVGVWCRLVRPRGYANPGSGDPAAGLRARGLDAVGRIKSARLVQLRRQGRPGPRRWIDEAKRWARDRLDRSHGARGQTRAVLGAILLGDRAALGPDLLRRLRSAGLIHLVAISGLHVGLVGAMVLGLLRRLGLDGWVLLLVAAALLTAFVIGVGGRPPVVRAALATGIAIFGRHTGREGEALNSLALVAAGIAAINPPAVGDAGYQLSFAATAGILLFGGAPFERLPFPGPLGRGLAVSCGAYVATVPLAAWHFRWIAPVALLSNLLAAPLCAGILAAGYGSMLFHGLPLLGELFARGAGTCAGGLLRVAALAASLDHASWRVSAPAPAMLAVYYGLLVATATPLTRRPKLRGWMWSGVALAAIWIHAGPPPPRPSGELVVHVLDVGQGQAVVMRAPDGGTLLADAGGGPNPKFDPGERVVLPFLDTIGARRIDLLVLSHGDLDHAGGAAAILRELEVGELWLGPGSHERSRLSALAALAVKRGTAVVLARRGVSAVRSGLRLRIVAPESVAPPGSSPNDRSVVLLAGRAPARILIPGDLEAAGERRLLRSGASLEAEALVLAHHGAANGTGNALLARVRPIHAVASCGFGNRFGHPGAATVERLRAGGVRLWRTDLDGSVRLEAVADGWRVTPTRRPGRSESE
jgi:competence protein ComEC